MKYTLQAIRYSLRNILYLLPLAVVPALFLSGSVDSVALETVIHAFFEGEIHSWTFPDLFRALSILNFASLKSIGFGVLGVVALIVSVSMMMAFLEKHMRYGKRSFNGIVSKINDNLLPTLGFGALILVIYEIWTLIFASILYLCSRFSFVFVAYAMVAVLFVVLHFVLLYTISMLYLWLPCMQITGFRAAEALQYSNQLSSPLKWHIILSQTASVFIMEALLIVTVHFSNSLLVFTIISTLLFALMLIVFCVRMEIVYFASDNIERRDLRKYY